MIMAASDTIALLSTEHETKKPEKPFELKDINQATPTVIEDRNSKQSYRTTSLSLLQSFRLRPLAPVTHIEYCGFNFLITQMPDDDTVTQYIDILKMYHVTAVVRVCNATYKAKYIFDEGIEVHDFAFSDRMGPPQMIVDDWLNLVAKHNSKDQKTCIAVHCAHGLGRAQLMVGIVLMELGLRCEEAVKGIKTRKGDAMNAGLMSYLANYSVSQKMKFYILYLKKAGFALIKK